MDSNDFEEVCKKAVSDYTNEHMDKTDGTSITPMMSILFGSVKPYKTLRHLLVQP